MSTDATLGRYFRLSEFAAASHVGLDARSAALARLHTAYLDPVRLWWGRPIHVTSFIRAGDRVGSGVHATGLAVDVMPEGARAAGSRPVTADLQRVAYRIWSSQGGRVSQVIWSDEIGNEHIHVVLAGGVDRERQRVYYSPRVGSYIADSDAPPRGGPSLLEEIDTATGVALGAAFVGLYSR